MNKQCIICKLILTDAEQELNLTFHSKCAPSVIKEAWDLLNSVNSQPPPSES